MDKNDDIQVNKVSKWDYGVVDMSLWHLKDEFDALVDMLNGVYGIDVFEIEELTRDMYSSMDKVLERFNELEAVHQKECGMISQYEEENRNLKDDLGKIIQENTELEEEKIDLEDRLAQSDELRNRACKYSWAIKTVLKKASFSPGHIAEELRFMARESTTPKDVAERWEGYANELLGGRDKEESKDIKKLEEKWKKAENTIKELTQVLNYEHIDVSHSKSSWTIHNRALSEKTKHFDAQLHNLREIIRDLKADNVNLQKQIDELTQENHVLRFKTIMNKRYGIMGHVSSLKDQIETLEKENKELKDTLEKDGEFGKNIGKRVVDSIREGCDKGVCKLHPLTRIDIHVEETNNMPTTFDRHAIPRIAVMFNNTQTEMERDTAQHECEELNEKVDRLWSVNDELNRKIKGLEKENQNLKQILKRCEWDANAAQNLCHNIAFNDEPCNICTTKYALRGDDI